MAETLESQLQDYIITQELKDKIYSTGDYALAPLVGAIRVTTEVGTMATNSKEILINPEYFNSLNSDERYAVFMHEICHIRLGHYNMPWKLEPDYDHDYANIAMDIIINETLVQNGLILPAGAQRRAANLLNVTVPKELQTTTDIYRWFKEKYPREPVKQEGPNYKGNIVYDKVAKQWGIITSDADGNSILAYDPISEAEAIQKLGYTPKVARKVKAESVATEAQVNSPDYDIYMPMQPTGEGKKGPTMSAPSSSVKFPPVKKGQQAGDDGQDEDDEQSGQSGDDEQDEDDGQSRQSGQSAQKGQKGQKRQSGQSGDDEQDEDDGQSGQGGQDEDDEYEDDEDDEYEDDEDDKRPTLKDLLDTPSDLARKLRNTDVKNPVPFFTPSKDSMGLKQILNRIFKDIGSQFKTERERTYARPNRRQQSYPTYQPTKGYARESKSVPRLIIYVDFSGSMGDSVITILSEIQYNLRTLTDAKVRIKAFGVNILEISNISDKNIYTKQGIYEIRRSTDLNTDIPKCVKDVETEAKNAEHVLFITDLDNPAATLPLFNAIKVHTTIVTNQVGFNCTNPLVTVYEGIKFRKED